MNESPVPPDIILIHGFRGAPAGLAEIATVLKNHGLLVHIPAIPPFAGATQLSTYTPEAYAKYIADFIKQNQLEKPILVGHSMGSLVAAATAKYYPDLIDHKLILLSPISDHPSFFFSMISPLSAYLPRKVVDYITTRFLFVPHDHKLLQKTLKTTAKCSSDHFPNSRKTAAAAYFSTNYAIGDFITPNHHFDITLIAGAHDRLVKRASTKALADNISAKTVFLPNAGHLHNYEQPNTTASEILEALNL